MTGGGVPTVADDARILREIAAELEASASAKERWASMAEGNARRPNLPAGQISEHLQAASRARQTVSFLKTRAAAARAGARALERA